MRRLAFLVLLVLLAAAAAAAPGTFSGPHNDRHKLTRRCGSCHVGHGVARSAMLPETGERLCYRCHGDPGARERTTRAGLLARTAQPRDIESEFQKPYRHPIERAYLHQPREALPGEGPPPPRHVACVDCHNPHTGMAAQAPSILGLRARRASLPGVATEAEMCFRCHGPTANRAARARDVSRDFAVSNASTHAVLSVALSRRVPSLLAPWTPSSLLSCCDCHGSDNPSGPQGPHGSTFPHLLREQYLTADATVESQAAYALCYRCHSRQSILRNDSFRYHSRHLAAAGGRPAACRACHVAHGSIRSSALIEFDRTVVLPDRLGRLSYQPVGAPGGLCRLSCHGVEHPISPAVDGRRDLPPARLPLAPGIDAPGQTPFLRPSLPPAAVKRPR